MVRTDPKVPSVKRLQKIIGISEDEAYSLRGLLKEVRSIEGHPSPIAVNKYGVEVARQLKSKWKILGKCKGFVEGPTWKLIYSPCSWKILE
tara:strand:+ start:1763 stop:2035 length:273 start_codon:yes stop_codon:yes gene_type:complete